MDTETTLENITRTAIMIGQTESLIEEANRYTKNYFNRIPKFILVLVFIILIIPTYKGIDYFTIKYDLSGWRLLILFVMLIVIPLVVEISIFMAVCRSLQANRLKKYNCRIIEIEKTVHSNLELLRAYSKVPESYWYSYAVNKIHEYIINLRAENLKEAINLYEAELKHNQQIELLKQIQTQQTCILNELNKVKNTSRGAEFASWLSVIK